jgi:lipocalin
MKVYPLALALVFTFGWHAQAFAQPPPTVSNIDLTKYLGEWYQISPLPSGEIVLG